VTTERAARPRRPPPRRIRLGLALVLLVLALAVGVLVGYAARGDPAPAGLVTEERSVPVITVTVPSEEP
jgi:hypothetical protein